MEVINTKSFKITLILLLLFVLLTIFSPGCYLIQQGKGQWNLRFHQIPLEEAIENENDPEIRKLLKHIPAIKQFAEDVILLEKSKNYSSYYSTDEEGITYVVTASEKLRLKAHTWWFPIVGTVPYLGFFNKKDAVKKENELKSKDYDTWLFPAPTYSTLGWLKDPVTTPMLRKGLFSLANSVIHELTHLSVYIKGEGDFNEQLASFVGEKGADLYLKSQGLWAEHEFEKRQESKRQRNKFDVTVKKIIIKLDSLYDGIRAETEVLKKREVIFSELVVDILKIYPQSKRESWKMNNARILQYRRYKSESGELVRMWEESENDWEKFWKLTDNFIDEMKNSVEE